MLQVVVPYLVVSLAYVLFSDFAAARLIDDPRVLLWVQNIKGGAFVTATAVGLYLLIGWQLRRVVAAERLTQQQEAQFAEVFDNALSGMIILGTDGKILRVNEVAAQMLGYTPEQLIGTDVVDLVHPDDRALRSRYLEQQLNGYKPEAPLEVRYRHRDGGFLSILVSAVLVRDPEHRPQCFICQVMNVTERRRAEEELQEHRAAVTHASRLITLGELAAGLTHELTQPITAIGHYADVACRQAQMNRDTVTEVMNEAVEGVREEARRARGLIGRWREFARGQSPRPEPIDANQVVREAQAMLTREARRAGVAWRLELQAGLPRVRADRIQIEQVLVNLIANAIDALATRGGQDREVLLRTTHGGHGGSVVITVADNGPGVASDHRARLFEPFFTTKPEGVGLGLSISRSIVQSHGGSLELDFEDGWTKFCFELPLFQEQGYVAA